jgi:hypothetical protein
MTSHKFTAWLVAVCLPLALLCVWQSYNQGYPRNDKASYFLTTQEIANSLQEEGVMGGFKKAYFGRAWRPILQPALGVPFLLIAGGHVLRGISFYEFFVYLALLTYVFFIFRIFLHPLRASLATSLLGGMPWLFERSSSYNAELPFLVCVAAVVYYFSKNKREPLKRGHWALGIWFGLGICARPVEMICLFFIPVFLSFHNFGKKSFFLLAPWGLFLAYAGIVLFKPIAIKNEATFGNLVLLLFLWSPMALLYFLRHRLKINSCLFFWNALCYFIVVFWYYLVVYNVYRWTSLSIADPAMAIAGAQDFLTPNHLSFLVLLITGFGIITLIVLVLMGVLARENSTFLKSQQSLLFLGLAMVLFPLCSRLLTHNDGIRYYYGSGLVLFTMLLIYALGPGLKIKQRVGMGFCLLVLLAWADLSAADGFLNQGFFAGGIMNWRTQPTPAFKRQDPTVELVEEMKSLFPTQNKVSVAVLSPYTYGNFEEWTFNPWGMTIIARERGLNWWFDSPWLVRLGSLQERLEFCRKNYDYLLVGPLEEKSGQDIDSELVSYIELHKEKLFELRLKTIKELAFTHLDGRRGRLLLVQVIHE